MDAFKGFSLYDILSMIIPGGILLWILTVYCPDLISIANGISQGHHDAFSFLFLCPFAYIIGMVNHIVASKLWGYYRNNPYLLVKCLEEEIELLGNPKKLSEIRNRISLSGDKVNTFSDFVEYSFLTAIGIVAAGMLVDILFQIHMNAYAVITLAVIYTIICVLVARMGTDSKEVENITSLYYAAYYYNQQENKNSNISVMEGQVAFLQSMIIPLALLLVTHFCVSISKGYCAVKMILLVIYIAIFPVIYNRLRKIHSLVWESTEFIHNENKTSIHKVNNYETEKV